MALGKVDGDPSAAVSDLAGAKGEVDSAESEGLSAGDANQLRSDIDALIAVINGGGNGSGNGNGDIFVAAADHPYNGNTGLDAVQSATRRCYLGGADSLYNGFQSSDAYGGWLQWTASAAYPGTLAPGVAARPDKDYLFPLARIYNPNFKGVISVTGKVAVSGVVRGRVTLTATDNIILADDVIYATDPGAGLCQDMLGIFSGQKVVVADNLLNAPQKPSASNDYITYDDTKDEFFHGIILALDIFTVEKYNNGSRNDESCEATVWGRGCIYLTGGVIQTTRGAVGLSNGSGYLKRYSYDGCAAEEPPPYFPTTGHFSGGQYYQVDPTGFSVPVYYEMLTP